MFEIRIRKINNLAVVLLSEEMLVALEAREGDTLYWVRDGNDSLKIVFQNPEVAAAMDAAQIVMDKNHDMLQALA